MTNVNANFNIDNLTFGSRNNMYVATRVGGDLPRMVLGSMPAPLRAPFGVSTPYSGADSEQDRRTFELELEGELLDTLKAIDDKVLAMAIERSVEWFGRKIEEPEAKFMHTPLVQVNKKDPSYKPTVRTKFSVKRDKETAVYVRTSDTEVKVGSKAGIGKNAQVCVDVVLTSVMVDAKKFHVSLTCEQVLVMTEPSSKRGVGVFGNLAVVPEGVLSVL